MVLVESFLPEGELAEWWVTDDMLLFALCPTRLILLAGQRFSVSDNPRRCTTSREEVIVSDIQTE